MKQESSSGKVLNDEENKIFTLLFLENSEWDEEDEDEQAQFKDYLDNLYNEVTNPDYEKNSNVGQGDKATWLKIFQEAIPYIVDKPDDIKNKEEYPWAIRPLTFEGYCDSFKIGFDIHFKEKTKKTKKTKKKNSHLPIKSGLNENKKALWGKLRLEEKAIKMSEDYGITSLSKFKKQHYVFVKFKEKKEGTQDADKNRGLYLRLDIADLRKEDDVEYCKTIRKIMSQRNKILQIFTHDLSSGTLKHILEERDAHRALATSKIAGHGENEQTRTTYYTDCEEAEKQILLLNSNRTLGALYQKESEYFENEYKGKTSLEEAKEVSIKCASFPRDVKSLSLAKEVWNKISCKPRFTIEVKWKSESSGQRRKVTLTIEDGKDPFTNNHRQLIKYVDYPSPTPMLSDKAEIMLDFIFLLAYNSGKHFKNVVGVEGEIDFNIKKEGQFIIFRSNMGCTEYCEKTFINTIKSLVIPPYVREEYVREEKESGKKEESSEELPGITLWSLSRYFSELNSSTDKKVIPIERVKEGWKGGYNYFEIQVKRNTNGEYDFIVKINAFEEISPLLPPMINHLKLRGSIK
ncbi:hypothetical protein OfM1_10190 [Lactovum odontotermitis]